VSTEQAARTGGQVESLTLDVGTDITESARVRAWARAELADLTEEALADTILVLDELVSNALRHGKPPQRVRLTRSPGLVRIDVDDAERTPAAPRRPSENGGRGLVLIDACASAWGQEVRDDGKTVWAELAETETVSESA
jgi:two-component sensor histidine kinase